MLRWPKLNFLPVPEDVAVSARSIEQHAFAARPKDRRGECDCRRSARSSSRSRKSQGSRANPAEEWTQPTDFDKLTPQFPQGRIILENPKTNSISARAVDLLTPLGRGQRGLIVAPPRVGKTILLKEIAKAIRVNHPEIVLISCFWWTSGRKK